MTETTSTPLSAPLKRAPPSAQPVELARARSLTHHGRWRAGGAASCTTAALSAARLSGAGSPTVPAAAAVLVAMGMAPLRLLSVSAIICHCQLPRAGGGGGSGSCDACEGGSHSLPRRERLPGVRRARRSGEMKLLLPLSAGGGLPS